MNPKITELEDEKNDLLADRAKVSTELTKVKTALKITHPRDYGTAQNRADLEKHGELIAEIAEIDQEISEINTELKVLRDGDFSLDRELSLVVPLVAAYIASGSDTKIERLTSIALDDLKHIRAKLVELRGNV